jgi:hypothetical protein
MTARFKDLVLDANDHHAIADWWCTAIGYVRKDEKTGYTERPADWPIPIVPADDTSTAPLIWVNSVPERKTVKNRMHIDVYGDPAELLALGATHVRRFDDEDGPGWDILADPEGNEFCVFTPRD